jgi:cysteine protease ATG4
MTLNSLKIKIYILLLNCKEMMENTYDYIINNYMLNDVEYIKSESSFDFVEKEEDIIYIFGESYIFDINNLKKILDKIPHFCYRKNIPISLKNGLDNDIGWGCMIRTGQMMLCKVLNKYYSDSYVWFFDSPEAYFSIHNITNVGEKNHIPCGNWFNPSGLAHTLKNLVNENNHVNKKIKIVIGRNGYLYEDEIINNYSNNTASLILIPVMLGIEKINPQYIPVLLKCFEIKNNVGIIGGKPRQSLYFIGKKEDDIFFLDPHIIKNASLYDDIKIQDNDNIRYIDVYNIDPCMLLCFLIETKDDFIEFKFDVMSKLNNGEFSLFTIENKEKIIDDDMNFDEEDNSWIDI